MGEKAAKVLARRFGTMQALSQATEEELTSIDDVGPITAAYIRQWMESPQIPGPAAASGGRRGQYEL